MIEAIERQIKPAILAVMTSVATLTSAGAGKMAPQNGVNRSVKQAPAVQRGKTVRYGKQVPGVQVVKGVSSQEKRIKSGAVRHHSTPQILIPDMPELKFSNKLATFPVTQPENAEYYRQQKYKTDKSKYNTKDFHRCLEYDMLRLGGPYVPDIFYEKAQLPYAERIKFYNDPEWKKIMSALDKQFGNNIEKKRLWNGTPLISCIKMLCSEMLTFGRPLASLTTETESAREAVYLCGMTQLGNWMDIQKAKNREFKDIIPEGYNEKEAQEQQKHLCYFKGLFGNQYAKDVGEWAERPIRGDIPYLDEADFAHLTVEKKNELLDLFDYMPYQCKDTPCMGTGEIYALYQKIQADQTGYRYVQQQRPGLSRAQAEKVQQLSLEMVIYKRPLALLRAEDYSLEQVMKVCQFHSAEKFYRRQQSKNKKKGRICEEALVIYNLEADALVTLGKKFNHPDWSKFGQEMYEEGKTFENTGKYKGFIQKHDDRPLIQNQVAKVADEPRVRKQDDSTNATSRVKRDADNGMK